LLTPNGRSVADMFISIDPASSSSESPTYFLHVDEPIAQNMHAHLKRHIFRKKVELDNAGKHSVWAMFGKPSAKIEIGSPDPRHPSLGLQLITAAEETSM